MQTEIKRWGNSAAVRLPSQLLSQAKLSIGSAIHIEVAKGTIIIKAADKPFYPPRLPLSETDLLKGLDARGAHADELAE